MKKIIKKILPHKKDQENKVPNRITADTVALHRQKIIASGRRFKYPIQYERHRLVFNTILISLVAIILAVLIGWWQLYPMQNTSEFMYRVTRVLPLSVAEVDSQPVPYSNYLMKYRSSVHYLEQKEQVDFNTKNSKKQLEYLKQQSLSDAMADAYAAKLAKNLNISVSDSELANFIKSQRQTSDGEISEKTYNSVILDYYGWTPSEYQDVVRAKLLRQKVAYSIDKSASSTINKVKDALSKDSKTDFKSFASTLGAGVSYGNSGLVPKTNQDSGLALAASKLEKGAISSVIQPSNGDGYYVLRLLDVNDTKVNYEYMHVSLTTFNEQFEKAKSSKQTKVFISVKM